MADPQDLESLRSEIAFEVQTRPQRFERIGDTEPEDPEKADLLRELDDDEPSDDRTTDLVLRMSRTLTRHVIQEQRMMTEAARSLGFDLRALAALTERVAEQEREIEMLRRAVEDLRRGR